MSVQMFEVLELYNVVLACNFLKNRYSNSKPILSHVIQYCTDIWNTFSKDTAY